jgi:CDP-diacylglycerol---glycerol-3-phosphate 3-phosphatidyltransferase
VNLPNALTVARIFAAPVVAALPFAERWDARLFAFVLFVSVAVTDYYDGKVARTHGLVTDLGKLLDPLADKLLVSAALISLVELNRLAAWVAMVIIAREFSVTGLRLIAAAENVVIAASPWGKVKTTFQVAAIIALILDDPPHAVTTVLVACAVAATIWSGIEYFISARDLLRAPA